nr:hypothetical protein [Tanacetum cinerariifolium]
GGDGVVTRVGMMMVECSGCCGGGEGGEGGDGVVTRVGMTMVECSGCCGGGEGGEVM